MRNYLIVLAIALLPTAGTIIGTLIAETARAPKWVVGSALHGAAGIAIAVVSVNLMPRILEARPYGLRSQLFSLAQPAPSFSQHS